MSIDIILHAIYRYKYNSMHIFIHADLLVQIQCIKSSRKLRLRAGPIHSQSSGHHVPSSEQGSAN